MPLHPDPDDAPSATPDEANVPLPPDRTRSGDDDSDHIQSEGEPEMRSTARRIRRPTTLRVVVALPGIFTFGAALAAAAPALALAAPSPILAAAAEAHSAAALPMQEVGRVTGQVINSRTGQPLSGAHVTVPGTNVGALTDNGGRYLLAGIPRGEVTV